MSKTLTLLCMIVCLSAQAQVPTDWQVDGLKGKVKKLIKLYSLDSGKKYMEEINYDKAGFITTRVSYTNIDPEHYYSMELIKDKEYSYSAYKGNKRLIKVISFDYVKRTPTYTEKHQEEWLAGRNQYIYVFGEKSSEGNSYVVRIYNTKNQLTTEEYFNVNKKSEGTNTFYYTMSGDISKKKYNRNNQYYVLDGDEVNSIEIKKDKKNNVIDQYFKRKSIDGFYTEQSTYEYY